MKRIKLIGIIILTGIISLVSFSSCDLDDGYSLDYSWPGIATIHPLSEGSKSFYMVLDNGDKLWIAASDVYGYKPKEGQRALVDYTILSDEKDGYDHYVKLNNIKDILTKGVIDLDAENQDSIGNDPVKILTMWVGDHYLNIGFGYNVGYKGIVHFLNLVNNTLNNDLVDGAIPLEFRHNANGDDSSSGVRGYVAFDLRPYQVEGKDSVDFLIKVRDFSDEKEYKITYNYKENSLNINKELDNLESNFDATKYK